MLPTPHDATTLAKKQTQSLWRPLGILSIGLLAVPPAPLGYNPLHSDLGPNGEAFGLGLRWIPRNLNLINVDEAS